ncbi:MAG: AAA family ATPase [Campylobacterales bacterium]
MEYKFIETENYTKLKVAIANLKESNSTSAKMGFGYGPFGTGKTTIQERVALEENAILLRTGHVENATTLLEQICVELALETGGGAPRMYQRILESLIRKQRIIIIDEIDIFLGIPGVKPKFHLVDLFRDIHDKTGAIIFFIGMEQSLSKFKKHVHFYSRITEVVEFVPNPRDDVKRLCEQCSLPVADDAIDYFTAEYANLREIFGVLDRAERKAGLNDIETLDLASIKFLDVEPKKDGKKRG